MGYIHETDILLASGFAYITDCRLTNRCGLSQTFTRDRLRYAIENLTRRPKTRFRTDTTLVFWDTGNGLILSHAARELRLWVCVRGRCPCAWLPPLPRLLSVCVCVVCVCVCECVCVCVSLVKASSAAISREQGPNKLSFTTTSGQCCGGHRYQVLRKAARTRAHSLCLCLSLYASLCLSPSPSPSLWSSLSAS
jgi:hypothetical protein